MRLRRIRRRIGEHHPAGADHVCVQALGFGASPDVQLLQILAPTPG